VLDLADVQFIDSAGLGLLLTMHERLRAGTELPVGGSGVTARP
jgi:anti-anti-sigma regulatory factor